MVIIHLCPVFHSWSNSWITVNCDYMTILPCLKCYSIVVVDCRLTSWENLSFFLKKTDLVYLTTIFQKLLWNVFGFMHLQIFLNFPPICMIPVMYFGTSLGYVFILSFKGSFVSEKAKFQRFLLDALHLASHWVK